MPLRKNAKLFPYGSAKKAHKYGAKKTAIIFEGELVTFDSKAESLRAIELQRCQMAGLISELSLQPAFVLQAGFVRKGKKIREIKFVADFFYIEDGMAIVEDVKGMETPEFKLKAKLFLMRHETMTLRVSKRSGTGFLFVDR